MESNEEYFPRWKMKKVLFIFLCLVDLFDLTNSSCDKARTILQDPYGGTFGNYLEDRNYTQNTQCEWYIQAGNMHNCYYFLPIA